MSDEGCCYVARKPCGCVVGMAVDDPKYAKDTAKDVADWLRRGCTVDRLAMPEARAAKPLYRAENHPTKDACLVAAPSSTEHQGARL